MHNKLIPYDVVYCSSEDDGHQIDQLVGHSYHSISYEEGTPGWQCGKGVDYPQVLILRFPGNVWLQQLRLLSHEVKIASKVEVRLYKLKREELIHPPSFQDVRFTKLGYVQFSNNEQSHYESKERKTIHLKAEAYFVKLLFYEPYSNPMNRAEQVGLYAIECVGSMRQRVQATHTDPHLSTYRAIDLPPDEMEDGRYGASHTSNTFEPPSLHATPYSSAPRTGRGHSPSLATQDLDSRLLPQPQPPQPVAPLSHLPPLKGVFRSVPITQFDTFFIQRTEELMALKETAFQLGDNAMVDMCVEKMSALNAVSLEMYALEQEKVAAIVEEDFGEANRIKDLMAEMMDAIVLETELPDLTQEGASLTSHRPISAASSARHSPKGNQYNHYQQQQQQPQQDSQPQFQHHTPPTSKPPFAAPQRSSMMNAASDMPGSNSPHSVNSISPDRRRSLSTDSSRYPQQQQHLSAHREPSISIATIDAREVNAVVADSMASDDIANPDERAVAEFIFSIAGEEERDYVVAPNVVFETRRLVSTVGPFVTACLLSKRFKLREAALVAITERMSDAYAGNAALVEDAVLRLLDYSNFGLQDNFPNVVLASCIYIRLCIGDEFQCIDNVVTPLCQLIPRLMTRAADPVQRIREEAFGTLERMVMHHALPSQVFIHAVLADPVDKDRAKVSPIKPRPQLARLSLLQMLLQEKRLGSGVNPHLKDLYSSVLLHCINHANSEVRDIAAGITQTLVTEQLIVLRKTDVMKIRNPALRDAVKHAVRSLEPTDEKKAAAAGKTGKKK